MVTLAQIRKQISALESQAAQITKTEMAGAIAKVKELMTSFGLTAEHLGLGSTKAAKAAKPKAGKKSAPAKRAGAGQAKYRDPKSGKTWTGFGRAPAWIASARSRDAFLIDASQAAASVPVAGAEPVVAKKVAKKAAKKVASISKAAAPAKRTSKPAATKKAAAKKEAASKAVVDAAPAPAADVKPTAAKKASGGKTAGRKSAAKKAPAKKAAVKKAAAKKAAPANKAAAKKAPSPRKAEAAVSGAVDAAPSA
jgi:DNA-binding protein H-NS